MATTVRFYPSHSNSIHYKNITGWGDLVNNTNVYDIDSDAGSKFTDELRLRFASNQFYTSNSSKGGSKWDELSRLAFLFNTTSLPNTLSVTGITLSLKIRNFLVTNAEGWDKDFTITPFAYNPSSTSTISSSEYPNFGNISYGNSISSSTFKDEERITFTFTELSWINADGVSKIGIRLDYDKTSQPPIWFPMQSTEVNFYDHTSSTENRPYIDVVYEDATSHSETFDERIGTPTTTAPGDITAPEQEESSGDSDWGSVKLLIQSNTTDGSTTIEDSSDSGHTITVIGDTHHETDQKKFGTTSIHFDGNGDRITIPTNDDFEFGTGDFTLEFWWYPTSLSTSEFLMDWGYDATRPLIYYRTGNSGMSIYTSSDIIMANTTMSANNWYHFAWTRASGTSRMFINGVLQNSTYTDNTDYDKPTSNISIGANGSYPASGYLEDIRITKGVARYTANFDTPTEIFPTTSGSSGSGTSGDSNWDNVQLLIQGNETHSNGDSVGTTYGAVTSVTATSIDYSTTVTDPYSATTYPSFFIDHGEQIAVPTNSSVWDNLGTTWTFETWFYRTSNAPSGSGHNPIFEFGQFNGTGFTCFITQDGYYSGIKGVHVNSDSSTGTYSNEDSMLSLNEWHHIAVCRNDSTVSVYGDGVRLYQVTVTSNTAWTMGSHNFYIGRSTHYGTHDFKGYMTDFRITKGVERYTGATYDEPTVIFPRTSGSGSGSSSDPSINDNLVSVHKLENNWNDSKGSHNLTANNGASFTTSKKLGTHAGAFDGTNDYAIDGSASTDYAFGTGDFSIAFWHWSSTNGSQGWDMLASTNSNGGTNGGGWFISHSTNSHNFYLYNGVSNVSTISATQSELGYTVNDSDWHHFVIERTSGVVKLYVDGSLKKTVSDSNASASISAGSALRLGGTGDGNYNFAGRLDEFAIWKGKGLTSSEVSELYNSGNGKEYDDTNGFATPASTSDPDGDSYWYNTTLLVNGENQSLQDKSTSNHTVTANGAGLQYNETYLKYGTGSIYFDGNDSLEVNNHSDHNFSSSDFTVEAWVYPITISGYDAVVGVWGYESNRRSWSLELNSGKPSFLTSTGAGSTAITKAESTTALTVNTWNHIAGTLSGTTGKIFVNGELKATNTSMNAPSNNTTDKLYIGSQGTSGTQSYFYGYIDDLRVTKGIVRYTADFTAPTKGFAEYALKSDVSTYGGDKHWDQVTAYYKFNSDTTDSSHEDPVLTTYKDPTINTDIKVATGSLKVNTTNPRLIKSGFDIRGDSVNFGTNDYTIESWTRIDTKPYYTNATTDEGILLDFRETVTDSSETPLDGVLEWVGVEQNTPISSTDNEDFRLTYKLKGSAEVKTSKKLTYAGSTTTGSDSNWGSVKNYYKFNSDLECSKTGTTPSTYSGDNAPEINTTTKKWTGSLYFDGSDGTNHGSYELTGDFTIEFWVYPTGGGTLLALKQESYSSAGGQLQISWSSNKFHVHNGAGSSPHRNMAGSITCNANAWYHFALVRSSNVCRVYIDGVEDYTDNNNSSGGLYHPRSGTVGGVSGGFVLGLGNWRGGEHGTFYMDDLRITDGVARYTSASTDNVPTEEFATSATSTTSGTDIVDFNHFSVSRRTPFFPESQTNGTFEGSFSSGLASGWTNHGSATVTEETTKVKSGSKSQKIVASGASKGVKQNISLTNGKYYEASGWIYVDSGSARVEISSSLGNGNTISTTGSWQQSKVIFKATSTATKELGFYSTSNSTFYVDDVTFKEVTASQYIHWGGNQIIALETPPTKFEGQPILFATSEQSNPNGLNSYWDDLRITSGVSRYTVDFDRPTKEFYTYEPPVLKGDEHWSKVILYLDADKSSILDTSATGRTITVGGTPTVDFTNFKIGEGSIFFDGTNDYVILADHADFDFGTGDFTVELWVRLTSGKTQGWLFGFDGQSGTNSDWKMGFGTSSGSTRQVEFYDMVSNSSAPVVSTSSLNNNGSTWHHIAVCRKDNEYKIFIDGALDKTHTFSGTQSSFSNVTTNRYIGQSHSDTTKRFGGYIDEVRITKGQARYSTTVDLQTENFPIQAQYVDYQGEDITVDIDDHSFSALHSYENSDTLLSNNVVQFIGNEITLVPEISHDPHSANSTDYLSSTTTFDNDALFRYQIRDTNSSIIRDVSGSDNKHIYFAYHFNGNTPVFHKIAIAGFQTDSNSDGTKDKDLWDATNLRGVKDPNINMHEEEAIIKPFEFFEMSSVQNRKDQFTANQFIFNAGCSFHMIPDFTSVGSVGANTYSSLEYTGDPTLIIADDSGNKAIYATEEIVTETKQELLEDIISPYDTWATNKTSDFGSNFEFNGTMFEAVHNDFYSVRNDTTASNVNDNDLGDYEFGVFGDIVLNPQIVRTLMGSSVFGKEEQSIEESDFKLEDSIQSVSEFTNQEFQLLGNQIVPLFDERYSYADPNSNNLRFDSLLGIISDATLNTTLKNENTVVEIEEIQHSETVVEDIEYSPNSFQTNIMARREQFSGSQTISYDTRYAESTVSTGTNGEKYQGESGATNAYFDLVQYTNEGFTPVHSISANNSVHASNPGVFHEVLLEDNLEEPSDTETDAYFVTDAVVKTYFTVDIPETDATAEGDTHFGDVVLLVQSDLTQPSSTEDPNWSSVTTLLNGEDNSGNNAKTTQATISNVTIDTSSSRWSGGKGYSFNGSSSYIDTNINLPYTGVWSLEFWIKPDSTQDGHVLSQYSASINDRFMFEYHAVGSDASKFHMNLKNPSDQWLSAKTSASYPHSNWYWCRLQRESSGNIVLYVNGTQAMSITYNSSWTFGNNQELWIGKHNHSSPVYYKGLIDDIRATSGVIRSSYTTPTAQLPTSTGATDFTDTSLSGHTITASGDVRHKTDQKKWGTSSIHFDGTGDYLTVSNHADLQFAGDFTIESWIRYNGSQGVFFDNRDDGNNNGSFTVYTAGTSQLRLHINGSDVITSANSVLTSNTWHHIACARSSGATKLFVDGVQVGSTWTDSRNISDGFWTFGVDYSHSADWEITGYMEDIRITKGVGRYTANFTAPTATFPNSTGNTSDDSLYDRVSLLIQSDTTDGSTTFLDGSENVHTIAPNADVHHDVNQKKFGNTSIYFDGSGDYLSCGSSNVFAFGNGDFTIELWAYHTSLSGQQTYITDPYGNNADGIYFAKNSSHKVAMYTSSWQITGSTSLSVDTWYHIALVRNNGTLKIYLDGTEDASVSSTTNFAQTQLTIGDSSGTTSGEFVGYMEDIRITRHTARYTSNFTKPNLTFKGATAQTSNNIGSDAPEFELEDSWFQATPGTEKTFSYDNFTPETFNISGNEIVYCVDEKITSTRNLDGTIGSQKKSQYKFSGQGVIPVVHYDTYKNGSGASSDYSSSFAQANKPLLTGSTTVSYVKPTETYNPPTGTVPGDSNWSDVNVLYNFTSSSYTSGSTQDHKEASTLTTLNGTVSVASTPDSDQGLGDYALRFQSGGAYMTNMSSSANSTFTLEGWVYKDSNNSNGYSYIWDCRGDNGSGNHVLIADQTDNGLYMYWDSTDRYRAGSQWTNDTWHHWAVVRSGTGTNNMKFYWNGAYITQWSSNSAFAISDWGQRYTAPGSSQYYLDGYMDEIRFTDGVARYSGTSTGVWTNFYNEKSGKSSGDAIDYAWATSTSGTSGTPESYSISFPTINTTAKDYYHDYQYDDSGTIKYWGTTSGELRPYSSTPNAITKGFVDQDTGNYLTFIEADITHREWEQNITNQLDTDNSSPTYNQLVFIQEIEPISKYKAESFQFLGGGGFEHIIDARWSNDTIRWTDANFNSFTEGGVGYNTSIRMIDNRFVNTVTTKVSPNDIPVFASKEATEELVVSEIFQIDSLIPARDYFGSKQVQLQSGSTFLPTLDLNKHFDITLAEGQFYALASGTFVDITSSYNRTTQKLTLTFGDANEMTDYTLGQSVWVGRFEASSSGQSVTIASNALYVIDSVDTLNYKLVLSVPTSSVVFDPPLPDDEDTATGDVTIITSSQNLAQLYYLLQGI